MTEKRHSQVLLLWIVVGLFALAVCFVVWAGAVAENRWCGPELCESP